MNYYLDGQMVLQLTQVKVLWQICMLSTCKIFKVWIYRHKILFILRTILRNLIFYFYLREAQYGKLY